MTAKRKIIIGLLLLMPLFGGCLWVPEFSRIVGEIEKQFPDAHFKKDVELNFGPVTLGLVRTVVSVVSDGQDDDDDLQKAEHFLREIRSVQVGVYKVHDLSGSTTIQIPGRLRRLLKDRNWKTAIKVREDNEYVLVLYKQYRRSIQNMFVITLSDEELVLVRASGKLNKLFDRVMEDHLSAEDFVAAAKH